ncbi:MAG: biotin transporter BioY [Oscillospiraceae bacterium]|nr:biotin transporter BioY [Oscillospiraceae bacterium]
MNITVKDMTLCALFAALLAVIAPFSINIGPIPISLATFIVYLTGVVIGAWRGTVAVLVYLLLGAVGLPVFSNFAGGLQKLVGVTGGYLIGYLPCVFLTGLFADRFEKPWLWALGMAAGTAVLYAVGTAWFCFVSGSGLVQALGVCVVPFLPGDAIKIAAAALLGVTLRMIVKKTLKAR